MEGCFLVGVLDVRIAIGGCVEGDRHGRGETGWTAGTDSRDGCERTMR